MTKKNQEVLNAIEDSRKVICDVNTKLDSVLERLTGAEKRMTENEKATHLLQARDRELNLRIIGMEIPANVSAAKHVYDSLLVPVFKLAVSDKKPD